MMIGIVKGQNVADGVKRRMIEQAALSLATRGLQRTSFTEVLEASGAPRGSLYHHFPGGKEELILAALELAGEFALHKLGTREGRSAVEVAQAFIDLWRGVLVRSDFGAGCAVAAVTVAADVPDLMARAAKVFGDWSARLAALLQDAGLPAARAAALATLLIAACEGAVILARAARSMEPFERTAESLLSAVAAMAVE